MELHCSEIASTFQLSLTEIYHALREDNSATDNYPRKMSTQAALDAKLAYVMAIGTVPYPRKHGTCDLASGELIAPSYFL